MDHGKLRGPVRKSENSEERMKIHLWVTKRKLASRIKLWLSCQAGKKIESIEEKGSVKIWELDSDYSNFYSDSSVESDTDESSDSLRSTGILSMHICSAALSFVCFFRPATLSFVSFFVFPILPDQLQEKPSHRRIISPPRAHCEKQGCLGDSRVNFTARKNFPNADWLSDLKTLLKAFVSAVCLRSKRFFLALFSRINFFAWSTHFKELQLKGNFFDCPQIWTVAGLTYNNQKSVCELFISKHFFSESDFCTITSHFFKSYFENVFLQLNMAKRRHAFLALFVLKPEEKIN